MEELEDMELVCWCGEEFTWTAGEQKFMNTLLERGMLVSGRLVTPRYCKRCRALNKRLKNL